MRFRNRYKTRLICRAAQVLGCKRTPNIATNERLAFHQYLGQKNLQQYNGEVLVFFHLLYFETIINQVLLQGMNHYLELTFLVIVLNVLHVQVYFSMRM